MSCPDIERLLSLDHLDETAGHIEMCSDCRRLVEMTASIGGDFRRTVSCDDADVLIAAHVTNHLDEDHRRWLIEHLIDCRHCVTVARSVLLDPPVLPSTPLAKVGGNAIRIAIPIVAVAAVLVFALVAITRLKGDDSPSTNEVSAGSPVEGDGPAAARSAPDGGAARDAAKLADAATASTATTPDASTDEDNGGGDDNARGGGPEKKPAHDPARQREAETAIQSAVSGGDLSEALAGCDSVRGLRWVQKCVVLSCRSGKRGHARRYLARLPKRSRDRFVNLCLAQGVTL